MARGTCTECGAENEHLRDGKCNNCRIKAKKEADEE
jgi:NMD protein affecting ribosome stability and mRNA decay